ncbi:MAG: TolC family protein [Myxococcales bacterium]|nr:TolC family protein [Myxococcales bacterium]
MRTSLAFLLLLSAPVALAQPPAGADATDPVPPVPDAPRDARRAPTPEETARLSQGAAATTPSSAELAAALRAQLGDLIDEGGQTAEQIAQRAVQTAPSVLAAERSVLAAEAATRLAWQGFFPQLEASFRYTRLSPIQQPTLDFGGGAFNPDVVNPIIDGVEDPNSQILWRGLVGAFGGDGFTFPVILNNYVFRVAATYPVSALLLSVLPSYRASQTAEAAQRAQIRVEQRTVALRAREGYYALARARGGLVVAEKAVEQVEARRAQIAALVEGGAAPRVDVMRVDAELARARVGAARARGAAAIAERSLQVLIHAPGEPIRLGEDFTAPLPAVDASLEALTDRALRDRPELFAMREVVRAREAGIRAELGRQYPQLALQAGLDYANPNQRIIPQVEEFRATWDVSVILRWSPNEMGQARQRVEQARAQILEVRANMEALEDAVRLEVAQSHEELASSILSFEAAAAGLASAEESYRVRREQLAAGAAVTADLVDAEAELTRARLDVVDAGIAVRLAKARLDLAVGGE